MEFVAILIIAAAVFGACFLVDKGFQKLFRSQAQHHSGTAVRLNKKYAAFGLILFVVGLAAVFAGMGDGWVLIAGGIIVMLMGIGLVVYYMTYGIFYDANGFVYTTFGKKSVTYRHQQIRQQQVYVLQGGGIVVELHMSDGTAVPVQLHLQGAEDFLNKAFDGWCAQRGLRKEDCGFHDPGQSCWFPAKEED